MRLAAWFLLRWSCSSPCLVLATYTWPKNVCRELMEDQAQTTAQTPVDGAWGEWSDVGACSETCGDGNKARSRACDSPAPSGGGADCPGDAAVSDAACNLGDCPLLDSFQSSVNVCPQPAAATVHDAKIYSQDYPAQNVLNYNCDDQHTQEKNFWLPPTGALDDRAFFILDYGDGGAEADMVSIRNTQNQRFANRATRGFELRLADEALADWANWPLALEGELTDVGGKLCSEQADDVFRLGTTWNFRYALFIIKSAHDGTNGGGLQSFSMCMEQ